MPHSHRESDSERHSHRPQGVGCGTSCAKPSYCQNFGTKERCLQGTAGRARSQNLQAQHPEGTVKSSATPRVVEDEPKVYLDGFRL